MKDKLWMVLGYVASWVLGMLLFMGFMGEYI